MTYMTTEEAAAFLGVEKSTLYAYVSRGLLTNVRSEEDGRRRQYRRSDLERLKRRRDARRGHEAAAADALQWGPASLTTSVERMSPMGPAYRGVPLRTLVDDGATFEEVAELLWTGERDPSTTPWSVTASEAEAIVSRVSRTDRDPVETCMAILQATARSDGAIPGEARRLTKLLPLVYGSLSRSTSAPPPTDASVAETLGWAMRLERASTVVDLLDTLLVVAATHGLNVSTFAARVAASSGAPLRNCLLAALAAFSGPKHGLHSQKVARWFRSIESADEAPREVERRMEKGESLPGFGHPFYEHGDPRFPMVADAAEALGKHPSRLAVVDAIVDAAESAGAGAPTLDVGFVYVCEALDLPPRAAPLMFACGRMAGWIAHIGEQRDAGFLLRPRSDYRE
jgi:citrate synthase